MGKNGENQFFLISYLPIENNFAHTATPQQFLYTDFLWSRSGFLIFGHIGLNSGNFSFFLARSLKILRSLKIVASLQNIKIVYEDILINYNDIYRTGSAFEKLLFSAEFTKLLKKLQNSDLFVRVRCDQENFIFDFKQISKINCDLLNSF